jgi:hypothetical protein
MGGEAFGHPTMELVNATLGRFCPIPPVYCRKVAAIRRVLWKISFIAKALRRDPVNDD